MARFPWRCVRAASLIIVLALSATHPAEAASQVLTAKVDPQPGGSTIVVLQFSGAAPKVSIVGNGTTEVSLIFPETTLSSTLPPTVAGSGPVSSLSLTQTGTASSLSLHLSTGENVQVRTTGATIAVNVPAPQALSPALQSLMQAPPPQTGLGQVTEVVDLKYADISEIAGALVQGSTVASNDTFEPVSTNIGTGSIGNSLGGFGGLGATSPSTTQGFGGGFGQSNGLAQRVSENIAVDRRLNAILLTGPPDVVAQLKSVIERLDVPVKSVILECEIVELSDSASKDIGVDFSAQQGTVGSGTYVIKNLETGMGNLDLAANIYGQVIKGQGKILAKPRILAQSGTNASILTGDAIPILTSVVVTGSSALTSNQVNYINVGVSLQIQPRVSDDGFVTSHIYSEVSSVTAEVQTYPEISQRQATTVATVRDGESFVIGGLLQDDEIRSFTKLPFVGDIPIIGSLFSHSTTSRQQTNLYIVVTPHIVRNYSSPPAQTIEAPVNAAPPNAPSIPASTPASGPPIVPSPVRP